jgi:hypothetical protein
VARARTPARAVVLLADVDSDAARVRHCDEAVDHLRAFERQRESGRAGSRVHVHKCVRVYVRVCVRVCVCV